MPKVTAKKSCCKDKPRCKTCPVVLHRLSKQGFGERVDARRYSLVKKIPRKALTAARAR